MVRIIISLFIGVLLACNHQPKAVYPAAADNKLLKEGEFVAAKDSFEFPKPTGYVNDFGNFFTENQTDTLAEICSLHEKQTTNQVTIATFDSIPIDTKKFESFATQLFNAWGVGQKGKNNGVLILVCKKLRLVRIETGEGVRPTLTDSIAKSIIDNTIIPFFKVNDFYTGIKNGLTGIVEVLGKKEKVNIQ